MRPRGAAALLAALVAAGAPAAPPPGKAPSTGRDTHLPIDSELLGAWWRARSEDVPTEAVHYAESGRYLRVQEGRVVEQGLWTTWVRGGLRWLRRCPAGPGGVVSPSACDYFGRYLVRGQTAVEEVVCPDAWQGSLTAGVDFEAAAARCPTMTHRFADVADVAALWNRVQSVVAAAPPVAVGPSGFPETGAPAPPPGKVSEVLVGTWVGTVGAGPEKVTLTFRARADGGFSYTLEAGGQEETSEGKWQVDNDHLILVHPDGEVEHISFTLEGTTLRWADEDLGVLSLDRKG